MNLMSGFSSALTIAFMYWSIVLILLKIIKPKKLTINRQLAISGAGLIGAISALALVKKKFKVLVIDKKVELPNDDRTLAVNANSIDFLKQLGVWNKLKSQPQPIDKIIIEDNINEKPWRTEGYQNSNWIIIDYVDIVVHIFFEETRHYYDLERIWFDATTVKI